jgi:hypothetical protein
MNGKHTEAALGDVADCLTLQLCEAPHVQRVLWRGADVRAEVHSLQRVRCPTGRQLRCIRVVARDQQLAHAAPPQRRHQRRHVLPVLTRRLAKLVLHLEGAAGSMSVKSVKPPCDSWWCPTAGTTRWVVWSRLVALYSHWRQPGVVMVRCLALRTKGRRAQA